MTRLKQVNNMKEDLSLSSMEAASQVCAQVLIHLATGTTPTNVTPPSPDEPSSSVLDYNSTTKDEKGYNNHTDAEHQESLTVALSILLDSTSPGPDPLALQSLGWAYGMGGGGGMGDWDGCHYMPGDIGQTLRVLQDQVVSNMVNEYSSKVLLNETDYLSREKAWWLQNHEVEYGEGYERSATRFCTVGGVPPWTMPYTKGGVLWGPPLAGVCVPSSCTADGLYMLFNKQVGFGDVLLSMAAEKGFYDFEKNPDHLSPPTASRRFRYMSSLAQSFNAGRAAQMGIICEGESGLSALDIDGYHSHGYYATVALIIVLAFCVLIGTISAGWLHISDKEVNDDDSKDEEDGKDKHVKGSMSRNHEEFTISKPSYGSNYMNGNGNDNESKQSQSVSFLNWAHSNDSVEKDRALQIDPSADTDDESEPLLQSKKEIQYIKNEERRGIELRRSASYSHADRMKESQKSTYYISAFILKIKSKFAYFDAGQSFYEITRMTREDPYIDSVHQQQLRKAGDTSFEPTSSTTGLFPMYKALSPAKNAIIDSDQTVSISSSKCLNGLRSISMLWIILGHTLAVQSSVGYVNPAAFLPPTGMMTSTLGKVVLSARYAVDTFFFIGGFLVMSGLLKRLDPVVGKSLTFDEKRLVETWKVTLTRWKIINPKHLVIGEYVNRLKPRSGAASLDEKEAGKGFRWVIPFLLHRILRILPTYGFVLLLWWKIAVHLGEGPFWPRWATFVAQCDAHAWTNMLFINNLVPFVQPFGETSECMYHAWYLGVDFQLCLVLAPIFLTLYTRKGWRMRTVVLEIITIVGIIIATIFCSFKYNWSAHLFDGFDTVAFDRGFYINPFFRSSPYIFGFITGQLWHEKCRLFPSVGLTNMVSILISFLSISIMVYWTAYSCGAILRRPCLVWESPRYSDCGSSSTVTELALFNSFARPAWGFGLTLMSLLCFNGQLTFLWSSSILNWPGWDPISKLSFSMYLLHPLVINVWVLGGDDKFRFSIIDLFFGFSGIVMITFIVAISIGVLVEWPMSKITRDFEKRLWSSNNKKLTDSTNEADKDCKRDLVNNEALQDVPEDNEIQGIHFDTDYDKDKDNGGNFELGVDNDYRYSINVKPSW